MGLQVIMFNFYLLLGNFKQPSLLKNYFAATLAPCTLFSANAFVLIDRTEIMFGKKIILFCRLSSS